MLFGAGKRRNVVKAEGLALRGGVGALKERGAARLRVICFGYTFLDVLIVEGMDINALVIRNFSDYLFIECLIIMRINLINGEIL